MIKFGPLNNPLVSRNKPPSSSGPGRSPLKAQTAVRVRLGAPSKIHPEPQPMVVEQFLSMLRFEQRGKLAELPQDRK